MRAYAIGSGLNLEVERWVDGAERCPFLTSDEDAVFATLATPKRRRDWLSGRLAAKRVVQRHMRRRGASLALNDIEVLNSKTREPYVKLPESIASNYELSEFHISISHTDGLAMCALLAGPGRIGVDVETVAPRDPAWLKIAFHDEELSPELSSDPSAQIAKWTLKEAALKLLGVGLSIDLWDIRCPVQQGTAIAFRGKARRIWEDLGCPQIHTETLNITSDRIAGVAYFMNTRLVSADRSYAAAHTEFSRGITWS